MTDQEETTPDPMDEAEEEAPNASESNPNGQEEQEEEQSVVVEEEDDAIVSAVNAAAEEVADAAAKQEADTDHFADADESKSGEDMDAKPVDEESESAAAALNAPTEDTTAKEETKPTKPKKKETKKRMRRVGKTNPRKIVKISQVEEAVEEEPQRVAATDPTTVEVVDEGGSAAVLPDLPTPRVLSKHDEKWNAMLEKLAAFKVRRVYAGVCSCVHANLSSRIFHSHVLILRCHRTLSCTAML
jgi:hypothetical protein